MVVSDEAVRQSGVGYPEAWACPANRPRLGEQEPMKGISTGEHQLKFCKVALMVTWRLDWRGKTKGRETIKELLQQS